MPEEQIQEPQPLEQNANPPQTIDISLDKKQKKSKKWLWMLLAAILILILIGVGFWVWLAKPFSKTEPSRTATKPSTSTTKPSENKGVRTNYACENNLNIWILDVTTKGKIQITKDGSADNYYHSPNFVDSDSVTYLKCFSSKCEVWLADLTGSQFATSQLKKLNKVVTAYDVDSSLKTVVYMSLVESTGEIGIANLASGSADKKVTYDLGESFGRGGFQDDSFYIKLSPDGQKFLVVDTALITDSKAKIIIWDINGNKLDELTGKITMPVWLDNKTIIYRDIEDGILNYDLATKRSSSLSSEKDWTGLTISPNGKKLMHNKGLKMGEGSISANSGVFIFDLTAKTDSLVGDYLYFPSWVNDQYVVSEKLKKCAGEQDCESGSFVNDNKFVVTNLSNNTNYEIAK